MHELQEFETESVWMRRLHLVEVGAPPGGVDRILAAATAIDPLAAGPHYDRVSHASAPGDERYRPRDGAVAGAEKEVRCRPGVVFLRFEVEGEDTGLARRVEAIFQVHAYRDATIRVGAVPSAPSKGRNDRDNPNRWRNATGDRARRG